MRELTKIMSVSSHRKGKETNRKIGKKHSVAGKVARAVTDRDETSSENPMRHDGSFGLSGRARGVAERCDVVGKWQSVLSVILSTQLLDCERAR